MHNKKGKGKTEWYK